MLFFQFSNNRTTQLKQSSQVHPNSESMEGYRQDDGERIKEEGRKSLCVTYIRYILYPFYHQYLLKLLRKSTFLRTHTPPPKNVAILHLLVYCGPIQIYFFQPKMRFQNVQILPNVKFMISLYKLNTGGIFSIIKIQI